MGFSWNSRHGENIFLVEPREGFPEIFWRFFVIFQKTFSPGALVEFYAGFSRGESPARKIHEKVHEIFTGVLGMVLFSFIKLCAWPYLALFPLGLSTSHNMRTSIPQICNTSRRCCCLRQKWKKNFASFFLTQQGATKSTLWHFHNGGFEKCSRKMQHVFTSGAGG